MSSILDELYESCYMFNKNEKYRYFSFDIKQTLDKNTFIKYCFRLSKIDIQGDLFYRLVTSIVSNVDNIWSKNLKQYLSKTIIFEPDLDKSGRMLYKFVEESTADIDIGDISLELNELKELDKVVESGTGKYNDEQFKQYCIDHEISTVVKTPQPVITRLKNISPPSVAKAIIKSIENKNVKRIELLTHIKINNSDKITLYVSPVRIDETCTGLLFICEEYAFYSLLDKLEFNISEYYNVIKRGLGVDSVKLMIEMKEIIEIEEKISKLGGDIYE